MTDGEVNEVFISSLPVHEFICCIKCFVQLLEKPFPYEIWESSLEPFPKLSCALPSFLYGVDYHTSCPNPWQLHTLYNAV